MQTYSRRVGDVEKFDMQFALLTREASQVQLEASLQASTVSAYTFHRARMREFQAVNQLLSDHEGSGTYMRNRAFSSAGAGSKLLAKVCQAQASNEERINLLVEARVLALLGRHPNILHLVGVVDDTQRPMLLAQLPAGGQLHAYLQKQQHASAGPLTPALQRDICINVASAMAYLESMAVVHRALSTRTVWVGEHPADVKLAEFGGFL